ncbi:MAK10-like protein [Tanacetum coccineum]
MLIPQTLVRGSKPTSQGFLKTMDSLDLDVANRERMRLHLFQFSLRDQASNWLERFGAGSIFTWEDLTTHFLSQFFPPGRTEKLHNDILMFQQHHGKSISEAWTHFKDLLQNCEIDRTAGGKLNNKNADESWEIIEKLSLYNHEGWNDSKDCVKPVKAISTSQNTSKNLDQILLELEDQINFLQKEESRYPITKNVNSISLIRIEEEKTIENNRPIVQGVVKPSKYDEEEPPKEVDMKNEAERKADDELAKSARENVVKNEENKPTEVSSSHDVGNSSRKNETKTYKLIPKGPVHGAILKKKITKKEEIRGNFEIPCNIGRLKNKNALVDQGSDVNIMPFSIYNKLTDERPTETNIRLSLASHSYIYPLGIAEDVLVVVVGYVIPHGLHDFRHKGGREKALHLRNTILEYN